MSATFRSYLKIGKQIRILHGSFFANLHNVNFVGRDIITPECITKSELKALLWTTAEMKAIPNISHKLNLRHITLLFSQLCQRHQICFERAAKNLQIDVTTIIDKNLMNEPDVCDIGRSLSKLSDAIITYGYNQDTVQKLADGSSVPVINVTSDQFSLLEAVSNLFTLHEILGPLRYRSLAWVGPPHSLCNTLMYLGPKLGLGIKLFCPGGSRSVPELNMQRAFELCHGQSELHESSSAQEAIYRADIIVTSIHNQPEYCITSKVLEEAALSWYFLHTLPRSKNEVSDDVFKHKNNLTWKSVENCRFVAMALLLRIFKNISFATPTLDFKGEP